MLETCTSTLIFGRCILFQCVRVWRPLVVIVLILTQVAPAVQLRSRVASLSTGSASASAASAWEATVCCPLSRRGLLPSFPAPRAARSSSATQRAAATGSSATTRVRASSVAMRTADQSTVSKSSSSGAPRGVGACRDRRCGKHRQQPVTVSGTLLTAGAAGRGRRGRTARPLRRGLLSCLIAPGARCCAPVCRSCA